MCVCLYVGASQKAPVWTNVWTDHRLDAGTLEWLVASISVDSSINCSSPKKWMKQRLCNNRDLQLIHHNEIRASVLAILQRSVTLLLTHSRQLFFVASPLQSILKIPFCYIKNLNRHCVCCRCLPNSHPIPFDPLPLLNGHCIYP